MTTSVNEGNIPHAISYPAEEPPLSMSQSQILETDHGEYNPLPPPPPHDSSTSIGSRRTSPRPETDRHFGPSQHERARPKHPSSTQQHSQPPPRAVRRMSSVPELGETNRCISPADRGRSNYASQSLRRPKMSHGGWPLDSDLPVGSIDAPPSPYEGTSAGRRLVRQKSVERGIVHGGQQYSGHGRRGGERSASGGSMGGSRGMPRSRQGSVNSNGSGHLVGAHPASRPVLTPELQLSMAFNNSIASPRGFTQPPHSKHHAHPNAGKSRRNTPFHHRPSPVEPPLPPPDHSPTVDHDFRQFSPRSRHEPTPRSYPYLPQPPFSATSSVNSSPHSSLAFHDPDALRGSLRSALSNSEVNRCSGFTTDSEAYHSETYYSEAYQSEAYYTESSNAMTVDEAIGMYASDSEDEFQEPNENRRSKGDSVLGGATMEDSGYRSKGDSVLGGARSPQSITRRSEQDAQLADVLDHKRISGDSVSSVGRGNEADAEGESPAIFRSVSHPNPQSHMEESLSEKRLNRQSVITMVQRELDSLPSPPTEAPPPIPFDSIRAPAPPELTYQSLIPPGDEDILPPHTPILAQQPVVQPKKPTPVPVDRYGYAHSRESVQRVEANLL